MNPNHIGRSFDDFFKEEGIIMNDRFKLRVFDYDDNKMHDVIEIMYREDNTVVEWLNSEDKKRSAFIGEVPIVQCTGLKDKNGKLIYEGNIVRLFCDEFENIHTVKFGDFAMYSLDFQTEYEKGSTAVYGYYLGGLKYPIPLSISLDTSGMQIEVIGNIYENKELLNDR